MIPFLKLIRSKNLLAILLTMIGVAYFLHRQNPYEVIDFDAFHFGLLVFSTLVIAAAGHIINDYFDLKADRINKPDELILSRYMNKRWAILANWIFNIIGFLIALILSWHYHTLLFVFVHLLSINLLWFYSAYWKRKLILGTAVLAALPALVLFLSSWFFQVLNESSVPFSPYQESTWSTLLDYRFIYFVGICAFFINLSREIFKDIRDIPGDDLIDAHTIPRKIGAKKAGLLALIMLQMPAVLFLLLKIMTNFSLPSLYTTLVLSLLEFLFLAGLAAYFFAPDLADRWSRQLPTLALILGLTCLYF
ncbi:MAG: UbiA family prenyltransferase [Flavobacteriales bacterium]